MPRLLALSLTILLWALPAQAITIVTPPGNAAVEGDSNNASPFFSDNARYQQLYDASLFGGQTGLIDRIRFRLDGAVIGSGFGPANFDLEIRLSHTATTPATISPTFATNIGADETLVLDAVVPVTSSIGASPNPFDIVFDVDNLFNYNGVDNLLLDIRKFPANRLPTLDAVTNAPGATLMNRVFSTDVTAVSGTTGTGNIRGLVTAFDFAMAVPEPGTLLQLSVGLGALGLIGWRTRRRQQA